MDLNKLVRFQTFLKEHIIGHSYLVLCPFSNRKELYLLKFVKSLAGLVDICGVHFSTADVNHILSVIGGID
jgi:hypothetical protein